MDYAKLKKSDRKFIRTEKARIRKQFLDVVKQQEMITAVYKKILGGGSEVTAKSPEPKKEKEAPKKEVKAPKKAAAKPKK